MTYIPNGLGSGWAKGKEFVPRKLCELCGNAFYAPPSGIKRGQHRFCSNSCRAYHLAHNKNYWPQTHNRRGFGGFREDLKCYFRSCWEANYARYLNWLKEKKQIKSWEYESETFEFKNIKRGNRFYTPDFKIFYNDGRIERHEVKGYMDARSFTKLKRMKKNFPEIKIILIDKKYYYDIKNKIGRLIPNWENTKR
jgi:hypothetical protein